MSVPSAELTAPVIGAPTRTSAGATSRRLAGRRLYVTLGAAALILGALSLLIPSTPSYDPWAWLVWGHEIVHLDLHTTGGPSWKPLPMIFTTVFALFGHAQPDLWLMVGRAGAVMAVLMAFRVAWRITRELVGVPAPDAAGAVRWLSLGAPLLAGLIAAGSMINSRGFISDNALGYSEGLATALMLVAVDSWLDGARRQAFVVGFFAALDRPELWFFWGPYGLYLFWRDPGARKLVVALFALIPVLWFLPELWGSGHLLRGVTRAQHPRANSAAFAKCPVCTVFKKEAWPTVMYRVKIPAILGMIAAAVTLFRTRGLWWRRSPVPATIRARAWLLILGVFALVWWLGIALETQAGFSGNDRYLVLGTAPMAIAGGIAWGWIAAAVGAVIGRLGTAVGGLRRLASPLFALPAGVAVAIIVFVATPPYIGRNIISLPRTHRSLIYQAHLRSDLTAAVHALGGPSKVLSCGSVMTEGFQVPMVAWTLGVRTLDVEAPPNEIAPPPWPNTIFQARDTSHATLLPLPAQILAWEHDGAHYHYMRFRTFTVFSTCAGKVAG